MAHFNFVISQNAKWWHAGFYIDCHRMTSLLTYRKIFFYKKSTGKSEKSCFEQKNAWSRFDSAGSLNCTKSGKLIAPNSTSAAEIIALPQII